MGSPKAKPKVMRVEWVGIDEVRPYENNPRRNDEAVAGVAASIREFGWQQPIVVDADGAIIIGHTRLKAAKQLGLEQVPVVRATSLTPEKVNALRLADNKTGEAAEWDEEKLAEELDGLLGFDMEQFGFDLDDVAADLDEGLSDDYSDKVGEVVYEPSDRRWTAQQMYELDGESYADLIDSIEDEGVREMCRVRMAWMADFHFDRIADYYANQATEAEQRAFEALALVLLDRDGLIENGFSDILAEVSEGL